MTRYVCPACLPRPAVDAWAPREDLDLLVVSKANRFQANRLLKSDLVNEGGVQVSNDLAGTLDLLVADWLRFRRSAAPFTPSRPRCRSVGPCAFPRSRAWSPFQAPSIFVAAAENASLSVTRNPMSSSSSSNTAPLRGCHRQTLGVALWYAARSASRSRLSWSA